MTIDTRAAELAIAAFLRALGHDPERDPELGETPARVVEAFANELLSGYMVDVAALLSAGELRSKASSDSLIVVRNLAVATVCPHHLMPATGWATVAYVPGPRLLGIGTISNLVDAYARRLTLQETIGENVVRALVEHAAAQGAYCELRLAHSCMTARGPRQAHSTLDTIARAGKLTTAEGAAELALALGAAERRP